MRRRPKRAVRLEMTALMDVMFLVLVFFIYNVFEMSVHHGVRVDLPNAPGSEQRGERVIITVRADDSLQLNGQNLSRNEIVSRLKRLQSVGSTLPVIISGDRKAHLGAGIELLSELKSIGIEHASFQVSGK